MLRILLLSFVLALSMPVPAQSTNDVRNQVESSLRISGTIVIDTDGKVLEHHINPSSSLTPALTTFLDRTISNWRFEPVKVGGVVVRAKVSMNLRLVAKQRGDGNFDIKIDSTYFGPSEAGTNTSSLSESLRPKGRLAPPVYPKAAMQLGGKGPV